MTITNFLHDVVSSLPPGCVSSFFPPQSSCCEVFCYLFLYISIVPFVIYFFIYRSYLLLFISLYIDSTFCYLFLYISIVPFVIYFFIYRSYFLLYPDCLCFVSFFFHCSKLVLFLPLYYYFQINTTEMNTNTSAHASSIYNGLFMVRLFNVCFVLCWSWWWLVHCYTNLRH